MRAYRLLILFLLSSIKGYTQLSVTNSNSAVNLVNKLVGQGVTVFNQTLSCANNGAGTFISNNTTLGIDSGIILTTGFARTQGGTIGSNGSASLQASSIRSSSPSPLDPNILSVAKIGNPAITSGDIYDVCKLEFDFVPVGDTLQFKYKFMSEEYPEYVCSNFNDIFGLFISAGPGYPIPKNLALVPNTNIPVTINTINGGISGTAGGVTWPFSNCTSMGPGSPFPLYYANNSGSTTVTYDGGTVKMTVKTPVTACSTYHFKFAVADIFDQEYDSGVFIEAGSFKSEGLFFDSIHSPTLLPIGWPYTTEGCNTDTIYIKRKTPKPTPQIVYLTVGGNAINGVDYTFVPPTLTIPAFDTIVKLPIAALNDVLTEGTETLTLGIKAVNCSTSFSDTLTILINEFPNFTVTDDDTICFGDSKQLSATQIIPTPFAGFNWAPINNNQATVNITPLSTANYTLTATYPGCPNRDSIVKISVALKPNINAGNDTSICIGSSASLNPTLSLTNPYPISINWLPASTLSSNNTLNTIATPTVNTAYTVIATNSAGCSSFDIINVNIKQPLTLSAVSTAPNCTNANGTIQINNAQSATNVSYTLNPGNITNNTGLFTGLSNLNIYTVTAVHNTNVFCSTQIQVNLGNIGPVSIQNLTSNNPSCAGNNNGSITAVANGLAPFTYSLSGVGNNSNGIFNNLSANTYTLTITDANLCSTTTQINIINPPTLNITNNIATPVSCNGLANGSIIINATGNGTLTYSLNNSGFASSNTFNNLSPNNYTITVKDVNNCTTTTVATITQPAQLALTSPVITNPLCIPPNSGSISFSATGGNGGNTYSIIGVSSNATGIFSSLVTNIYTIQATDSKACTTTSTVNLINTNNPQWNNVTTTPINCFGNNNGAISGSILNSSGNINYTITPNNGINQNDGNFTSLIAGNYTIQATDANGCSTTNSITITTPNQLTFNIPTVIHPLCSLANNGSIQINAAGGTAGYTYQVNGGAANNTGIFNTLSAGTYTINVTDFNNCTASTNITITQPSAIAFTNVAIQNVSCNSGNNGSVNANAAGGTGGITYTLNGVNSANGSYNNLTANTYTLIAKDANNCTTSSQVTISHPSVLVLNNVTTVDLSCVPSNNGSIQFNASGGTPGYNYTIQSSINSFNNTTGTFNSLLADTYTIMATDSKNCTKSSTVTLNAPNTIAINFTSTIPTTCNPSNTGSMQIGASGGNSAFTYTLNGGNSNSTGIFNNLTAGVYNVVVSDNKNCTSATAITISTTPSPQIGVISTTLSACNPGCTGTAGIQITGGSGIYTLNIGSITQSSSSFNNLCPGNYTVQAVDNNGCTTTKSFVINSQPNPNSIVTNIVNVQCNSTANGSISVSGIGGTPPYNYTINTGASSSSGTFNNLGAGSYTITTSDFYGCTTTLSASITQPSTLSITNTAVTHLLCHGNNNGVINVSSSGGQAPINFILSGPSSATNSTGNFTGLSSGVYTVQLVDANSCSLTTQITLTQPPPLLIQSINIDSATCYSTNNGGINAVVSGGTLPITYTLTGQGNNNTGIFNNLAGGSYNLTVSDGNNCTIATNIQVLAPPALNFTPPIVNHITCHSAQDGSITTNIVGGLPPYNFYVNNVLNGSLTSLSPGSYTLAVTDAYMCTRSTIVNITEPTPLVLNSISSSNVSCSNGTNGALSVSAIGGNGNYTYSILPAISGNNTNGQFNNLPANNYTITTIDNKGCQSTIQMNISEPSPLNMNISLVQPTCYNSSNAVITGSASGGTPGYNYALQPNSLSNNSGVFSGLGSGVYTLIITDANSCTASTQITLTTPSPIIINSMNTTNVSCFGGSDGKISLTASGGTGNLNYQVQPGLFNNTTGQFTNLSAGNYIVTVTDAIGCSTSSTITVNENPQLIIDIISAINPKCSGDNDGQISFAGSGGVSPYFYTFNNASVTSTTINNLSLGTYTLSIKDAVGCMTSTTVVLNEPSPLVLQIDSIANIKCNDLSDGMIKIDASFGNPGTYNFLLLPKNIINTTGSFTGLSAGTYSILVTDILGCSGSVTVTLVNTYDTIDLNYNIVLESCSTKGNDGSITAIPSGGTEPYAYQWINQSSQEALLDSISTGSYILHVTDAKGCKIIDTVELGPPPCCAVYFPNVFTPNGDKVNDEFYPIGPASYEIYSFSVYDRWGTQVFSTINPNQKWDGTYKNQPLEIDTYYYLFRYKCRYTNEEYFIKGDIQLMK